MLKTIRRWWQIRTGQAVTPFDGGAPYYFFSMVVHLVLVFALASIFFTPPYRPDLVYEFEPDSEKVDEIVITELEISDVEQETIGNLGEAMEDGMISEANQVAFQPLAPTSDFRLPDNFGTTFTPQMDELLAAENNSEDNIQLGQSGVGVEGATGAIDRITDEFLQQTAEGPVLAIWLFDQSASLQRQREEIRKRFDRVYRELDQILEFSSSESPEDSVLLTQVYQFGSNLSKMMEEPTRDVEQILQSFEAIENDPSGIERTFAAVTQVLADHKQFLRSSTKGPKRKIMIMVVTDEVGDDYQLLDSTIVACRRVTAPVYIVGVPAPFGRQATPVKWVDPDPDYDQTPQWTSVSQGPESLMPERLKLGFFGIPEDDLDIIDSGFGPFALSRLAVETGGIYFAVHPNRRSGRRVSRSETAAFSSHMNYFFDPMLMQRYRPDYVSVGTYSQNLRKNGCRESLVQAALQSNVGALVSPGLRFEKLDEAAFVNSLSQAQRAAALLEPQIDQLYNVLIRGEKDRERETVPRWKAGYDLAMGRILAAKVRTESYNTALAAAKTRLNFEDPKNNTWKLVASESIEGGSRLENMAEKAEQYLERVVKEHKGTPWELLARRELSTPFGWEWQEAYTRPPAPPRMNQPAANNNNNVPAPNDDQAMMLRRKPRRQPPKL